MTKTDWIAAALALYFLTRGWRCGILSALLGPMSLALGLFLGYFYYAITKNILFALSIAVLGPIIFNILFYLGLKFWQKKGEQDDLVSSLPSRISGSAVYLMYGGINSLFLLVLVLLIPDQMINLSAWRADIHRSHTYALIAPTLTTFLFHEKDPNAGPLMIQPMTNPQQAQALQADPEFQSLMSDDKLQKVLNDPELIEQVNKKDYTKLFTNPKILEMTQDEALLKKLFAIYAKILRAQSTVPAPKAAAGSSTP